MSQMRPVWWIAIVFFGLASSVAAQDTYPSKPIRILVGYAAGGGNDIIVRVMQPEMQKGLGQPMIVENRPGAQGIIAADLAAKAAPDGYTIVMGAAGPTVVNKILNPALGYDPERDFAPISLYASLPNVVVVSTKLPIQTLGELADYVRKTPKVPYGSVGNGSSQHLAGALFEQLAGVKMTHVPYRVTSQLQSDLAAGEVPVSFQLLPNVIAALKGGQVRALAVANASRLAALPEVPTAAELGVRGYESSAWFGLVAPRGTPRPLVDKLHGEVAAAMADPALRARFVEFGAEPMATTPDELARFISAEVAKWQEIITRAGIRLDQ